MKINQSNKFFTRGGQITLHNIRMWMQITNKLLLIGIIIFTVTAIPFGFYNITAYERYVASQYVWSQVLPIVDNKIETDFIQPNGHHVKVRYIDIAQSHLAKEVIRHVSLKIIYASLAGLFSAIMATLCISLWLKRRGRVQTEDISIRGDKIQPKDILKNEIQRKKQASDLHLAGLSLIKNKETAHTFFHGTTGTGKSTSIKELLDQIRARGDRAILFDKSCNFLEEFYQPTHDFLLNPLDNRTQNWDLWLECRDAADFESIAAAQIPMPLSDQDPFWVNAARMIFASAAYEMRHDKDRSVFKLLRYLLTADLGVLEKYLKGTVAETLVSKTVEKTATNIKSVLATYLNSLKYVKEGKNPLSIRKWVQNDKASNWLFITSLGDRHETLKPLITSWLDIAVNSLLSLPPEDDRRIWFILDELTALQKLPYLTQALSEARKFGGCFVIGIQNYAQLQKLYGISGAKEISSLLNTRFLYRQSDPEIAEWSAKNLGETIVQEVHEGISYGANTLRDGISINRVETRKPLVSYSEIMSLSDLSCYVRLPGDFPVTKINFIYKKRPRVNQGFIMRALDEDKMKELDDLFDHVDDQNKKQNKLISKEPSINNNKLAEQLFDL